MGTFLNFVYGSSYLEIKKVHGYIISFEPQMVQSSYKVHLSKFFLRRSMKLKYRLPESVIGKLQVVEFLTTFNVSW